ncbi:MAG: septum formation protein Maf [Proteobacteria bacterium]|nr:septum formation protein Maf [Pseudomonadota bacterium]
MSQYQTLILASGSPRRRDLLAEAGLRFEVAVSDIPELPGQNEAPDMLARRLALEKALAIASQHPNAWVLGADTDVSLDGEILGKPSSIEDARRLLRKIQGRRHEVWGGFALVHHARNVSHVEAHCTLVEIAPMDEATIAWYVNTGEPMDKAGAYGAQGIGAQFIKSIEGSYTNVVGLALYQVMSALVRYGIYNHE